MNEQIRVFNDLKELGSFIRKQRQLKGEKMDNISKALLIKKEILKKFEEGTITNKDLNSNSHLKGFLNSYIKFLELEKKCKLELSAASKISNLNKSNLQLEMSGTKKNNYGSFVILLSLIMIGLTFLFWNKETYIDLYILGTAIK